MNNYVDRNGDAISIGASVQVNHCIGPYGQMQIDEGVVVEFDDRYRGVTLKLTKPARYLVRNSVHYLKPGALRYYALPIENVFERPLKCVRVHNDVEHAHTAWVQVVSAASTGN